MRIIPLTFAAAFVVTSAAHVKAEFLTPLASNCQFRMTQVEGGRFGDMHCPFSFVYAHSKTSAIYVCSAFFRIIRQENKTPNTSSGGDCSKRLTIFKEPGNYSMASGNTTRLDQIHDKTETAVSTGAAVDEDRNIARVCMVKGPGFFDPSVPLCIDLPLN